MHFRTSQLLHHHTTVRSKRNLAGVNDERVALLMILDTLTKRIVHAQKQCTLAIAPSR